jgi:hypothetical protein
MGLYSSWKGWDCSWSSRIVAWLPSNHICWYLLEQIQCEHYTNMIAGSPVLNRWFNRWEAPLLGVKIPNIAFRDYKRQLNALNAKRMAIAGKCNINVFDSADRRELAGGGAVTASKTVLHKTSHNVYFATHILVITDDNWYLSAGICFGQYTYFAGIGRLRGYVEPPFRLYALHLCLLHS